jgi:hypothetical protein
VRHAESGIDVNRAEHGLQDVGEQGRSVPAPCFLLPFAQQDIASQPQCARDACQPGLADDSRPQLREVAFGGIRVLVIEVIAHDQAQDGISQEFQSFVVLLMADPLPIRPMLEG